MKTHKGEAGFHAVQDPSSGEITVVMTPARDGLENTFTFKNSIELRVSLSPTMGVNTLTAYFANWWNWVQRIL